MSNEAVEGLEEAIALEDMYVSDEHTGDEYTHAWFEYEEKYGKAPSDVILQAARLHLSRQQSAQRDSPPKMVAIKQAEALNYREHFADSKRGLDAFIIFGEMLAAIRLDTAQANIAPKSQALGWASKAGATSPEEAERIWESYSKLKREAGQNPPMPKALLETAQSTGAGVEEMRQDAYLKCWNPVGDVSQADTFDIVDKVFDYLASRGLIGDGWRTIDENTPKNTELILKYNNDLPFIGRIRRFSYYDKKLHGADAVPSGRTNCGCGIEEDFVTHWKEIGEKNDAK